MTLPATGALSFNDINTELGLASGSTISINDTAVRDLTGALTGQTGSLSTVYGASYPLAFYPADQTSWTVTFNQNANTYCKMDMTVGTNGALGWSGSYRTAQFTNMPTGYHSPTTTSIGSRYECRLLQNYWYATGGAWSWQVGGTFANPAGAAFDSGWLALTSARLFTFSQTNVSVALGVLGNAAGTVYVRRVGQTSVVRSIPFSWTISFN